VVANQGRLQFEFFDNPVKFYFDTLNFSPGSRTRPAQLITSR